MTTTVSHSTAGSRAADLRDPSSQAFTLLQLLVSALALARLATAFRPATVIPTAPAGSR